MKSTFRGVISTITKRYSTSAKSTKSMSQVGGPASPFPNDCSIYLPDDLTQDELLEFKAFREWKAALEKSLDGQDKPDHEFHGSPYKLRNINVQAIDRFGPNKIGFLKLKAEITNEDGEKLPGSIFMRGASVAMLLILTPESSDNADDQWVILTQQPRIPTGSLNFIEIPAGMLDGSGNFAGTAAREIKEETGLVIREDELLDMSKMTQQLLSEEGSDKNDDILHDAMYPSPGGSDEYIPLLMARKLMPSEDIQALQGKLTGLRKDGEKISLRLVKLKDAWKVAARDAKALSALHLYHQLSQAGKL